MASYSRANPQFEELWAAKGVRRILEVAPDTNGRTVIDKLMIVHNVPRNPTRSMSYKSHKHKAMWAIVVDEGIIKGIAGSLNIPRDDTHALLHHVRCTFSPAVNYSMGSTIVPVVKMLMRCRL